MRVIAVSPFPPMYFSISYSPTSSPRLFCVLLAHAPIFFSFFWCVELTRSEDAVLHPRHHSPASRAYSTNLSQPTTFLASHRIVPAMRLTRTIRTHPTLIPFSETTSHANSTPTPLSKNVKHLSSSRKSLFPLTKILRCLVHSGGRGPLSLSVYVGGYRTSYIGASGKSDHRA